MCGPFSRKVLPSSSGESSIGTATVHIVLKVFGTLSEEQLNRAFPTVGTGQGPMVPDDLFALL